MPSLLGAMSASRRRPCGMSKAGEENAIAKLVIMHSLHPWPGNRSQMHTSWLLLRLRSCMCERHRHARDADHSMTVHAAVQRKHRPSGTSLRTPSGESSRLSWPRPPSSLRYSRSSLRCCACTTNLSSSTAHNAEYPAEMCFVHADCQLKRSFKHFQRMPGAEAACQQGVKMCS